MAHADAILGVALEELGYAETQRRAVTNDLHQRFVMHFKTLVSHGDTREKFAPLRDRLAAGTKDRSATAALLEHAQYQRALFEERPVFGREVFALRHVYIDTECGVLRWGAIRDRAPGDPPVDPFAERHGGRSSLGETVIRLLGDPNFSDAIVIQGAAGAGKSAFTQWLATELVRLGLRPVRILLRDVRLERTRPVAEALAEAIRYGEEMRRSDSDYPRPDDVFDGGNVFRERVCFGRTTICPYVLILDGWDEISISVSEGFKVRLDRMLEQIRTEFLHNRQIPIRVVLTGRPSAAVADSPFLRKDTPILTLRPLNPQDLETFVGKLARCINEPPLPNAPGTGWPPFDVSKLRPIIARYATEFASRVSGNASEEGLHRLEVFGLPLLALLAVRLLSVDGSKADEIIASPTVLYRNLVDLTCEAGGKYVDSGEPVDQQFRLIGGRLRDLLRRTAAAMTVHGKENISFEELRLRLKDAIDDLAGTVEKEVGESVLSQLMISYFFKGGHEELGCEFLHKSFREYLFAEGIVETLKQYGRRAPSSLTQRTPYWREFDRTDARFDLSRALSVQIAAQWLSPEVLTFLENLVEWEIGRAAGEKDLSLPNAQPTVAIALEQWEIVRDGLADLWDWWSEGVHLRPQPRVERRQGVTFDATYAQELVEFATPFDLPRGQIPAPGRTAAIDAHLGDALFRLAAWTHFFVAKVRGWVIDGVANLWDGVSDRGEGPRRTQSSVKRGDQAWTLFAPSAGARDYWQHYVARINSAGWRPRGHFPAGTACVAVDLRHCDVSSHGEGAPTDWSFANLSASWSDVGSFYRDRFYRTVLIDARWSGSMLAETDFTLAYLDGASLRHTYVRAARFDRCSCLAVNFDSAYLGETRFIRWTVDSASFEDVDLRGAKVDVIHAEGAHCRRVLISQSTMLPTAWAASAILLDGDDAATPKPQRRLKRGKSHSSS
ncbi:MAG: pentapeptide repeat-containing protein [Acidobacteriota bacterium]|nr:pentapeptide repeat-containing protein [Acidobacteriota bacterium]